MSGEIQDFEIATPEKILDKVHNSLYNYDKFPMGTSFPTMKKGEVEALVHPDFETAKAKFFESQTSLQNLFQRKSRCKSKEYGLRRNEQIRIVSIRKKTFKSSLRTIRFDIK